MANTAWPTTFTTAPATTPQGIIKGLDGTAWNGTSMVTWNSTNYATYPINFTQLGTSRFWYLTIPATLPAGSYTIVVSLPVVTNTPVQSTDVYQNEGILNWDGTDIVDIYSRLAPATIGRKLVVDVNGLGDANMVKGGPTGAGVAVAAATITNINTIYNTDYATVYDTTNKAFLSKLGNFAMGGTSLNLSLGTLSTNGAVTFGSTFGVTGAVTFNSLTVTGTMLVNALTSTGAFTINGVSHVSQTGDSFNRIGVTGSGLTSLAPSTTALSNVQWTNARAGYLDNANVGGALASQADVNAINQSASRRVILTTVGQYERPESGSTTFQIEADTFDGDGAAVNADTTPTLTATGFPSGTNLSANLSAASNFATGRYRWTYTVLSTATIEQVRFDLSATISASVFPMTVYSQVVDSVSATWTATDATHLTAVFNKLPTNNIADQTIIAAAIATLQTHGDSTWVTAIGFAVPGSEMALTDGERTAAAAAVADAITTDHGVGSYLRNIEPLNASDTRAALGMSTANFDTQLGAIGTIVTNIQNKTTNLPASPAAVGSQMNLVDGAITGSKIATGAFTSDKHVVPTEAAGVPTDYYGMIRRVFEHYVNGRTRDTDTGEMILLNAAGDAALQTQTQTTVLTVDSISEAT